MRSNQLKEISNCKSPKLLTIAKEYTNSEKKKIAYRNSHRCQKGDKECRQRMVNTQKEIIDEAKCKQIMNYKIRTTKLMHQGRISKHNKVKKNTNKPLNRNR